MRAIFFLTLLLLFIRGGARKHCDDSDDISGCQSCQAPPVDARRDCPKRGFDCSDEFLLANFSISSSPETHCLRLRCADPLAHLYVAGKPRSMLRCREGRWLFGPDASCHTAHTAVCAKACKCITFTPKDLYLEYDKALIRPAQACPVAYCPPGTALFGTPVNSSSSSCPTLIGVGRTLVCTGNRQWKETSGEERLFSNALCSKDQRCTDSCRVDSLLPLFAPPRGFLFFPDHDAKLEIEMHNTCMTLKCSKGSLATNCGVVERLTIKCQHEAKWVAIDGTGIKNASCVGDCFTCPSKFTRPDDEYALWTTDKATGCKVTLPCRGSDRELRYIESEYGNPYEADTSITKATCGADQKWYLSPPSDTFAVYGVGCREFETQDACDNKCPSDPKMTLAHGFTGYRIVSQKPTPANSIDAGCRKFTCAGGLLIVTMTIRDAPVVSDVGSSGGVMCKSDGYWYLNDDTKHPVMNMACGEACTGCNTNFGLPTLSMQYTIFSEYDGCMVPVACPSGPFYYAMIGGAPTSSTRHTPKCTNGQWKLDGVEGTIDKIFCGATSCKPLRTLSSFCPHGSLCPRHGGLLLIRRNSWNHTYECVNGGQLYVGEEENSIQPTPASCVSCIPGKDGPGEWRIDGSNVSFSHYVCAYQCGTKCDTRTSGSAATLSVKLDEKRNGCTVAQCSPYENLNGYILNVVTEFIDQAGYAFCIEGINKWMTLNKQRNPGRLYDRVECYPWF